MRCLISLAPSWRSSRTELGFAYALSGEREKASKILQDLRLMAGRRYTPARDYALVCAGMGEAARKITSEITFSSTVFVLQFPPSADYVTTLRKEASTNTSWKNESIALKSDATLGLVTMA
jgi:Flp pilus assembly protein TadD